MGYSIDFDLLPPEMNPKKCLGENLVIIKSFTE
jgi:hypothetical protein